MSGITKKGVSTKNGIDHLKGDIATDGGQAARICIRWMSEMTKVVDTDSGWMNEMTKMGDTRTRRAKSSSTTSTEVKGNRQNGIIGRESQNATNDVNVMKSVK